MKKMRLKKVSFVFLLLVVSVIFAAGCQNPTFMKRLNSHRRNVSNYSPAWTIYPIPQKVTSTLIIGCSVNFR